MKTQEKSRREVRKFWFDNDVVRSSVFNASSIIVPILERFVETTVEEVRPHVQSGALQKYADTLLHEEKAHYKVHERFNELLRQRGYRFDRVIRFEKLFLRVFERTGMRTKLALCLSGEYFTALMSKHTLEQGVFVECGDIDERIRRMWLWHSLEELHHRSFAFDLYQHVGGGYVRRTIVMLIASALFLFVHTWCLFSLLRQDKKLADVSVLKDTCSFMLGTRGYYGSIAMRWFSFFRPRFHPSQLPIKERLLKELRHYHVEGDVIASLM